MAVMLTETLLVLIFFESNAAPLSSEELHRIESTKSRNNHHIKDGAEPKETVN